MPIYTYSNITITLYQKLAILTVCKFIQYSMIQNIIASLFRKLDYATITTSLCGTGNLSEAYNLTTLYSTTKPSNERNMITLFPGLNSDSLPWVYGHLYIERLERNSLPILFF